MRHCGADNILYVVNKGHQRSACGDIVFSKYMELLQGKEWIGMRARLGIHVHFR